MRTYRTVVQALAAACCCSLALQCAPPTAIRLPISVSISRVLRSGKYGLQVDPTDARQILSAVEKIYAESCRRNRFAFQFQLVDDWEAEEYLSNLTPEQIATYTGPGFTLERHRQTVGDALTSGVLGAYTLNLVLDSRREKNPSALRIYWANQIGATCDSLQHASGCANIYDADVTRQPVAAIGILPIDRPPETDPAKPPRPDTYPQRRGGRDYQAWIQAQARLWAHEIGHLLGLTHPANDLDTLERYYPFRLMTTGLPAFSANLQPVRRTGIVCWECQILAAYPSEKGNLQRLRQILEACAPPQKKKSCSDCKSAP